MTQSEIQKRESEWRAIGEATSSHLKILKYDIDTKDDYIFLTIYADTDEAMGMNMVTIAAEAIGKWMARNICICTVPRPSTTPACPAGRLGMTLL